MKGSTMNKSKVFNKFVNLSGFALIAAMLSSFIIYAVQDNKKQHKTESIKKEYSKHLIKNFKKEYPKFKNINVKIAFEESCGCSCVDTPIEERNYKVIIPFSKKGKPTLIIPAKK